MASDNDFLEKLDTINQAYQEHDGENKDLILKHLKAIHVSLMKEGKIDVNQLKEIAAVCDGIFIPYLFWVELIQYLDGKEVEENLYELIKAFCLSSFEDEDKINIKPLLVIYFSKASVFQKDKVSNFLNGDIHPEVRDYVISLMHFSEINPNTVVAYMEKLVFLKKYYPNFEFFKLPITKIKDKIGNS